MAKRRNQKFTSEAKITITALSLLGFVGGWNLIAHSENQVQASSDVNSTQNNIISWPSLAPLPEIPAVPTLVPLEMTFEIDDYEIDEIQQMVLPEIAPLPTLAPLPTPAPLPELPPMPAPNWNQHSGGS